MKSESSSARGQAYAQYERLLVKLHELNATGNLDSDEADTIREDMELPWRELSSLDQARLAGLSADLYSLNKEEEATTPPKDQLPAFRTATQTAFDRGNWDELLSVLRAANQVLPPAVLAYIRGRSWNALGRALPASLFFAHAARLDPNNLHYKLLQLDSLARTDRRQEALAQATVLTSDSTTPPQLVFGAAKILFDSARHASPDDARTLYEQVVRGLREALKKVAQVEQHSPRSLTLAARINLALALERLGLDEEARKAYDDAVAHHADSDEALMARALFLLASDSKAALEDLAALVRRNTALSYPYFFLAHRALRDSDYRWCLDLCKRGIQVTTRNDVAANFFEWAAIAQCSLDPARDLVEFYFQSAQSLDPLNERIRRNLELFEQFIETQIPKTPAFDVAMAVKPPDAALDLAARLQPAA